VVQLRPGPSTGRPPWPGSAGSPPRWPLRPGPATASRSSRSGPPPTPPAATAPPPPRTSALPPNTPAAGSAERRRRTPTSSPPAVYGNAWWIALIIVIVTFALLALALHSIVLPIKALVLNVISIGAAYSITGLIWQRGVGTHLLFNQAVSGAITVWVPIAVFAFLFGLSMDYEVLLLSRIREEHDHGHDTGDATVRGVARTGRLVTSAALILFLAFIALSRVPTVDVKILATALALRIVIDAAVVRGVLAPLSSSRLVPPTGGHPTGDTRNARTAWQATAAGHTMSTRPSRLAIAVPVDRRLKEARRARLLGSPGGMRRQIRARTPTRTGGCRLPRP